MASGITIEELAIKLGVNSTVKQETDKAAGEIQRLEQKVDKSSAGMSKKFALVGASLYAVKLAVGAVAGALQSSISRVDTLNNFPRVMSNLGVGTDDAKASIDRLSQGLLGLPTTMNDAALSVQRFTSSNNNIKASTEMFLALNNAILAGGAPVEAQRSALEQLSQAYSKGKPDMMEWRSALTAMPAQMKQIAISMGYVSSDALGEAMRDGTVSMNEFMFEMMRLNKEGVGEFQSFEEQARNSTGGIATSITNLKTAITRGLADIMNAIGQSNIAGFFNGIASAINATIPFVVAFTKITMTAFNSLAMLFGGTTAKIKSVQDTVKGGASSLGGIGDSAANSSKGVDKLTKSSEKLRKSLSMASFDTAQTLKSNDNNGSGGSGGSGGGGGNVDFGMGDFDWEMTDATSKVDEAMDKINAILNEFNFDPLIKSFVGLRDAILPIAETIGAVLGYLWTEILVPLAKWTISDLLPAFINLLSGVLRVANPIIKAVATVGKFLFDVFLIPAAKFAGGIFVATINIFAQVLKGLGRVLENNQPILIAATVAMLAFYASFKTAQLIAYISQAGGVIAAIVKMTGVSKIMLAVKNSEIVVQLRLGALILKEQLARVALAAKIALETAATNGSTTAKIALAAATKIATVATTVFTTAVQLLSGPLGWIVLGITAVVGIFALYKAGADDAVSSTDGLTESQRNLVKHFENTEERLANQETAFTKLAGDTLPKLKSSYEDVTRTLAREKLEINTEGLDGLGEKTTEAFNTAKDAIVTNTDLMYQGLSDFYANSNTLTETESQEILNKVLLSGEQQKETVQGHYDAMMQIKNTASEEGRGLNAQEAEEYQFHLDELNRIAVETITPEQARQVAQLEAFNAKKGKLNEEEREEYLRLQQEKYDSELAKIQTEMGFQLTALEKAKNDKVINEKQYNEQKAELINQMNAKEYELMDTQAREILEMATGSNKEQLSRENEFASEYMKIQNKRATDYGYVLTDEEKALEKNYNARQKELDKTRNSMKDFNDNWLDKQPSIFKGVYDNINKGMSLQDGIDQINGQKNSAYNAGRNTVDGITQGVNDGESGAVNSMGRIASRMLARAKNDLEIRSPSRKMRALFQFVGLGAALGVDDNAHEVENSMSSMIADSLDGVGDLEKEGTGLVNKFFKGFDFNSPENAVNFDFSYPDFIGDNSTFNVNRTIGIEESLIGRMDNIVSGYEKMLQLDADREYVIHNHMTLDIDGDQLERKTSKARVRNSMRTGRD
ncbi:MAG: tape measure protein [Erysipelothrix sp.]